MKKDREVFAAHLGTQTLSLAKFRVVSNKHLVLHSLVQEKIPPISSLQEFCSTKFLKPFLYNWREREKIKKGEKLIISLPSQFLFTRFLKLPSTCIEEIRSLIDFEAQQNIPFPLSEVIWDYQIVHSSSAEGSEVLLIAGKREPLSALRKEILETGFFLERIDSASIALYNALRFNHTEVEKCLLLLDIGSYSTNIIISEGRNFFTRTVPLASATSPSIKKICAEIERSISIYCYQQGGAAPICIFLCGYGVVEIPDLQQVLHEKFQIQVQFFSPLRKVKISSERVLKAEKHTLVEVVGLALHPLKQAPISINLLKSEIHYEAISSRREKFLLLGSICLLFISFVSWIFLLRSNYLKSDELKKNKNQIAHLAIYFEQIQNLQKESIKCKNIWDPFLKAISNRVFWPRLINTLEESLPSKFIWMIRLEPTLGNKTIFPPPSLEFNQRKAISLRQSEDADHLLVEGLYLENPEQATVVDHFVEKLSQSGFFIISDKAKVIRVRDTPDGEHWAYQYRLMLPLSPLLK